MATKKSPPAKPAPFNSAFLGLESLRASMTSNGSSAAPVEAPDPEAPPIKDSISKAGAKVVVAMERKGHGGKTVTRVEGLDPRSLAETVRDMKRALGCGATEEDGVVLLQGDHRNRAAEWLRNKGVRRVVVSG